MSPANRLLQERLRKKNLEDKSETIDILCHFHLFIKCYVTIVLHSYQDRAVVWLHAKKYIAVLCEL